jgi:uncharacterized protein (DUF1810 family)
MAGQYNLERFLAAQNPIYADVCAELREGSKSGHWMWYIFPQVKGLGHSQTSIKFAISSRNEAKAYLAHAQLGPRLRECTQLVIDCGQTSLDKIFSYPDNLKFQSCMTLFANVDANEPIFFEALRKFCGGQFDPSTLNQLKGA